MTMKFNPLHYELCFAEPRRLTEVDPWHEHIPFAFACMQMLRPRVFVELGTHKGDSYCAFCQAVDMIGLATKCYAVDHWKGDKQAGFYDPEVLEELRSYHDALYGRFSRLLQSTFDKALAYFSDGTVDLLHIDGLHTYKAAKHDFERWLPKMSDRGVVLMHDTNVRERNFGVWKLWEELEALYPNFHFFHGHGLGILAVGKNVDAECLAFVSLDDVAKRRVSEFFSNLGNKFALTARLARLQDRLSDADASIAERDADSDRLTGELAAVREERERLTAELAAVREERERLTAELSQVYASTSWRVSAPVRFLGRAVQGLATYVRWTPHRNQKAPIIPFIKSVMQKAWWAVRHRRLPMSITAWRTALYRHYVAHQAFYAELQLRQPDSGADQELHIHDWQRQAPYERWLENNRLTAKLRQLMARDAAKIAENGPKISIVVPLYNTSPDFLHELIVSVTSQIYPNWELCLADDASSAPHVKEIVASYQKQDARIKAIFHAKNRHISHATNSALSLATGQYVALLDHDDVLPPDALLHVAECILGTPGVDWIYTDEDKIDESGKRFAPQFKGEWSPEMAITHNYTHHLTVIRTALVDQVGGMRPGFEGAQDLDLFLRVAEATSFDKVRHIPQICYHWRAHRDSTAARGDQKQYIFDAAKKAIEEALARRNLAAGVELPTLAKTRSMCLYQLRWAKDILADNPVTIVIPTRDQADLLRKCIESLRRTVDDHHVKLVIIDDKSVEPDTLAYFAELKERRIFGCKVVRNSHPHEGFNYSRLMNIAIDHVDTEYLLHLNNDIFATTPGWLEDMVGWLSVDGVGIVGAKLHYPDGRIQHAGVVAGGADALPWEHFEGQQADDVGYLALPHAARNVSAVTGACLLTTKSLYRALGGFDEERFSVEFNDIDFCLRAIARGERVVISPQATLTHVTGASRSCISFNPQTHLNYVRQYADFPERYFNRNLAPNSSAMAVNPTYFNHVNRVGPLKVLVISHELNLGGAPIVLSEYAEYFQSAGKYHVEVLSPQDGPLRDFYRNKGIPVHLDGGRILSPHKSLEDIRADLLALGQRLDLPSFDLIVCNTITTFWGIELAQLFSLPSIWHIHESTTARDFGKSMGAAEQAILTAAFTHATRVVFQCEATRRLYHQHDTFGRFRTIPGGLPLDRIAAYRVSHSKHALRSKYGINQDHAVVTLIGTTCLRKGQHIFVEAINLIQREYDSKLENVSFIMVGARPDPYLDRLKKNIADFRLKNVYIFNETTEIYDFFQLSDVFVCASFEESFPRVILLAMAFELRIVSTNVFGIAEIIKDGHDGRLIEPGDANAMAAILMECLQHEKAYERLAKVAVSTVSRLFDNQRLLPRHLDLTKEAVVDDFHV